MFPTLKRQRGLVLPTQAGRRHRSRKFISYCNLGQGVAEHRRLQGSGFEVVRHPDDPLKRWPKGGPPPALEGVEQPGLSITRHGVVAEESPRVVSHRVNQPLVF